MVLEHTVEEDLSHTGTGPEDDKHKTGQHIRVKTKMHARSSLETISFDLYSET